MSALDTSCPSWCVEHVEGTMPRVAGFRPVQYVEHKAPLLLHDRHSAWLELEVSTDDVGGDLVSDGPVVVLRDEMDGRVSIPVGLLEQVAGALVDAAVVLRQ